MPPYSESPTSRSSRRLAGMAGLHAGRETTAAALLARRGSEQRGDLFRKALGDHDRRDVGEARWHGRHDRGIDDEESLDPVDPPGAIDDGSISRRRSHGARANHVRNGVNRTTDPAEEVVGARA